MAYMNFFYSLSAFPKTFYALFPNSSLSSFDSYIDSFFDDVFKD